MRVFVAGASGALGAQLVPQLVAAGHEVVGMTRTPSKQEALRAMGALPAVADALDPDAVARAVAEAEPEVIVHQLTALSGPMDLRHFDRLFATTNRLRTEGTDHLLAREAVTVMMTEVRGASNAKAKRELGWQLRYPSWRQGFAKGLG
jgi:2-alkyl-3-oxoalkanoate reductase